MSETSQELLRKAADAIQGADAILIGAGAGMGVDSGLPDFRGNEGFWKAYPPFQKLGLSFMDVADPAWFKTDPHLAWGFYGHRLNLYRATTPHAGFQILKQLCEGKSAFVFTSNVDGHFQKAGFSSRALEECHGSINHFQCTDSRCIKNHHAIWLAESIEVRVDETSFRALDPLPTCPHCGALARPNILMFGDYQWLEDRTNEQISRFRSWIQSLSGKLVVVECGAGTAIPSVRSQCESLVRHLKGTLIRINVRESQGPEGTLSLPMGALEGLSKINEIINQ